MEIEGFLNLILACLLHIYIRLFRNIRRYFSLNNSIFQGQTSVQYALCKISLM